MDIENFKSIAFLAGASIVIKKFLDLRETRVSFGTVWEAIRSECDRPDYSLKNVNDVLKGWGFETLAARIKPQLLSELEYPVISHIIENGEDQCIVLTQYSEQSIGYIQPGKEEKQEALRFFLKKWQGVVIMASSDNFKSEKNYEKKQLADKKMIEEYVNKNLLILDNFFSQVECDNLIEASKNLFHRSMVTGNGNKYMVSNRRTSQSAFLSKIDDKLKKAIINRSINLLGDRSFNEFEDLQCVYYKIGEEFTAHFDAGKGIKRLYTILVYLNENMEGGETYFPLLDLKIKPKTGRAVLFHNLDDNGSINKFSFHAGLPVKQGEKIACNIWIR